MNQNGQLEEYCNDSLLNPGSAPNSTKNHTTRDSPWHKQPPISDMWLLLAKLREEKQIWKGNGLGLLLPSMSSRELSHLLEYLDTSLSYQNGVGSVVCNTTWSSQVKRQYSSRKIKGWVVPQEIARWRFRCWTLTWSEGTPQELKTFGTSRTISSFPLHLTSTILRCLDAEQYSKYVSIELEHC